MINVVHEENGIVISSFYIQASDIDFPHVVLDREILEPIESWYIEDGEIKIDPIKLAAFNRSQLRPLTRRQFKLSLLEFDLLTSIETKISEIEDPKLRSQIQIEYAESEKFERQSESVAYMVGMLDLTTEQVDAMWLHAMTL